MIDTNSCSRTSNVTSCRMRRVGTAGADLDAEAARLEHDAAPAARIAHAIRGRRAGAAHVGLGRHPRHRALALDRTRFCGSTSRLSCPRSFSTSTHFERSSVRIPKSHVGSGTIWAIFGGIFV